VLCNWASGRVFGGCEECDDVTDFHARYQSVSEITERISTLESSLVEFLEEKIGGISGLDFDFNFSSDNLHLTVMLENNQDTDVTLNNIVYFLSKALDVFPGVITWELDSNKRQDTVSARIVVVDEQQIADDWYQSSASTHMVGVMAIAAIVLRLF
jgi:hypothetical protein